MRPWKWAVGVMLLAAPLTHGQSPTTVVLTSHYLVDIDYNYNPLNFFGSKLLGLEPDSMAYTETVVTAGDSELSFAMELTTYTRMGEGKWFFITSDTTRQSFTHLPLESKKELARDAILFVKRVRKFLTCHSICDTVLTGTFHMDTARTAAYFSDRKRLSIPDSEKIRLRGNNSRFVAIHTKNASASTPYITANVVVERIKDCSIYPYLSAHLLTQDIRIKLYLKSFSVEYK